MAAANVKFLLRNLEEQRRSKWDPRVRGHRSREMRFVLQEKLSIF